jgi:putative membrane protein
VTLTRVMVTAASLWLSAQFVTGIRFTPGLAPLTAIGTVLVVALLLCFAEMASLGLRRLIGATVEPVPLAVVALMALNIALFWLTGQVAAWAGLGYAVDGLLPAVWGAVVLLVVGWLSRLARIG